MENLSHVELECSRSVSCRGNAVKGRARRASVAALLFLCAALTAGADDETRYAIGSRPDLSAMGFVDQDGKSLSVVDLKGKVVVIEFWTTWCKSCRESLSSLLAIEKVAPSLGDLVVVPCDQEEQEEDGYQTVRRFVGTNRAVLSGLRYFRPQGGKHGIDANLAERVKAFPTTLLLDRTGRLAVRWAGFGHEYLIQEIDRLRAEKPK